MTNDIQKAIRINNMSEIDNNKVCYWFNETYKKWFVHIPKVGVGNISRHDIIEHEDKTISVSPSILITTTFKGNKRQAHGFLEKGIWREV